MSRRGDKDYKPEGNQLKGIKIEQKERPVRITRAHIDYKDVVEITDSEEESTREDSKGVVVGEVEPQTFAGYLIANLSDTDSTVTSKSDYGWSPRTLSRKTDNIITNLSELREQLVEARMAKPVETNMADIMKMMLEMNARDKQDRDRREAERDRIDEERRQEDMRREERREQREQELREEALRREDRLVAAMKDNMPAIPQTVHISSTKLPKMTEGEDLQSFIELFEAAMEDNRIPPEQWKAKVHAALDSSTKLKVRDTITNAHSTYDDLKEALVGCGNLSFSHASESLMTGERGQTLALPVRQAVQKFQRLLERMTREATNIKEACTYIAIAVTRYNSNSELKTYLDMKGDFSKDLFCRNVDEWLATRPPGVKWTRRSDSSQTGYDRMSQGKLIQRPGQGKKTGDCYFCGKPGHFAQECRTRLFKERQMQPGNNPPVPVVKKEPLAGSNQTRNLAEVTCFRCRQKGHISPDCPKRTTKIKRIKIPENKIVSLHRNEVFGAVGPHRMPITCDTGAEVTVVPEEAVEPHQKTGELCELKAFNDSKATGEYCNITITVGDTTFERKAVTQPGANLGWSVCLSLDMADPQESQFLLREMTRRAAMKTEDTLYVPPEVRDGYLMSGVLMEEAQVVRVKSTRVVPQSESEEQQLVEQAHENSTGEVPVQSTSVEAHVGETESEEKTEELTVDEVDELKEDGGILGDELNLVSEEEAGEFLGGGAETEGLTELHVSDIREGMPMEAMVKETDSDPTLTSVKKLALLDREGYHMSNGLIFRTRLDTFGTPIEQLCVPSGFRQQCLKAAHSSFGHQGRNRMIALLRPHFYWPCMGRDCVEYVRRCEPCQQMDKTVPRPNPMIEREVVTRPFSDVAVDVVGPFPTAKGGYRFLITCIDVASRWPEAFPVKKATAKVVIGCLTSVFVRWGFPEKLTSDNGSQFVGKVFSKWLQEKGIAHAKATPYHPQGNGVVERLHRTLNGVLAKTILCKGDWAAVLPMALFFIRLTPSSSTGISPFLLTHGWEPPTQIQLLYRAWVDKEVGGVDLTEWVLQNADRVEMARDKANATLIENSRIRAKAYNKRAKQRDFKVGDSVWIRRPGLDHKLTESWVGPGIILKKNSPVSFKVQTQDRILKTVNIQQLKECVRDKEVKRVTTVLEQDTKEDDVTDRFAEAKVEPQELSRQQQAQLDELMEEFKNVLDKEPGLTNSITFDIDTGDEKPIYQRPYNTPVALRASVDKEIDWLQERGFIRPSSSPWASPMVTVRKADGSARLCVDFRKVNGLTRQTPFYMPRVEEVLEGVGRAQYISKLDLSKGYYQVQLTQQAIPKTAFTSHRGTFEFTRMPFGVKNAPAAFQSLMQRILSDQGEWATAYMDDIVVFSRTWENHLAHIRNVLSALRRAGLTANPSKCRWGGRSVEFLGHRIGAGTMTVPDHRVTALATYTKPTTKKGLRAFLGSIGFYRRYVQNLAEQTAILTPLTTKQAPQRVKWTPQGECAFNTIRSFFCASPILCIPLDSDILSIVTDASGRGIGGSCRCRGKTSGSRQPTTPGSSEGRSTGTPLLSWRPWLW